MWSTIFASILHIWIAPYMAVTLVMKMVGLGIATIFHFFIRFMINFIMCSLDATVKQGLVSPFDKACWIEFPYVIGVSWNAFLIKVAGWWAFDVFTQLAALLSEREVAGQTILRNIGLFTYMIPVGLAAAMNFFTGKYIGMGNVCLARKISKICRTVSIIWSIGSMLVVWFF